MTTPRKTGRCLHCNALIFTSTAPKDPRDLRISERCWKCSKLWDEAPSPEQTADRAEALKLAAVITAYVFGLYTVLTALWTVL